MGLGVKVDHGKKFAAHCAAPPSIAKKGTKSVTTERLDKIRIERGVNFQGFTMRRGAFELVDEMEQRSLAEPVKLPN